MRRSRGCGATASYAASASQSTARDPS